MFLWTVQYEVYFETWRMKTSWHVNVHSITGLTDHRWNPFTNFRIEGLLGFPCFEAEEVAEEDTVVLHAIWDAMTFGFG